MTGMAVQAEKLMELVAYIRANFAPEERAEAVDMLRHMFCACCGQFKYPAQMADVMKAKG